MGISLEALRKATAVCMAYDHEQLSGPYKSKSLYMPDEGTLDGGFEATALRLVTKESACAAGRCFIQLSFVGGAMTEEHPNSAFVHRAPGWHLQVLVYWDASQDATQYEAWSQQAREAFLGMSIGESYQNYPDSDLDASVWAKEFFPRAGIFPRLIELKCKYNPKPVMDVPHSLAWMIPRVCS